MREKHESLELLDNERPESHDKEESSLNPKRADSVHILLKQALHADDCALLLDCLYTKDEKVVAKSLTLLNPSGVLKLLQSLICIIQSSSLSPEFQLSALQLSSVLDVHYTGVIDDVDDNMTITPLIYESNTSGEEGSDEEEPDGALDDVSDFDGIEDTSE